jgi:hypothetical protein
LIAARPWLGKPACDPNHRSQSHSVAYRSTNLSNLTGVLTMATYSLDELHNRWERDEMSVEQMLGHILQHFLRIEREMQTLKDLLLKCAQRLKDQGN